MKPDLAPLLEELDSNDRLRLGVYFIALLVLAWFSLVLSDLNVEARRTHLQVEQQYLELKSLGNEALWEERLAAERQLQEQLAARLWSEPSENQTLAAIQSTLRQLAADGGLEDATIQMGAPQWFSEENRIMQVRARIRATFVDDDALKFVALIEDFTPVLKVEGLSIEVIRQRFNRNSRFNMDVVAFYPAEDGSP